DRLVDILAAIRKAAGPRGLDEVFEPDLPPMVVTVPAGYRHRHLRLLRRDPARALAREGVRGEHVIQRRQTEGSARLEENAEVLCVTVDGAEQPEDELGAHEAAPVLERPARTGQCV